MRDIHNKEIAAAQDESNKEQNRLRAFNTAITEVQQWIAIDELSRLLAEQADLNKQAQIASPGEKGAVLALADVGIPKENPKKSDAGTSTQWLDFTSSEEARSSDILGRLIEAVESIEDTDNRAIIQQLVMATASELAAAPVMVDALLADSQFQSEVFEALEREVQLQQSQEEVKEHAEMPAVSEVKEHLETPAMSTEHAETSVMSAEVAGPSLASMPVPAPIPTPIPVASASLSATLPDRSALFIAPEVRAEMIHLIVHSVLDRQLSQRDDLSSHQRQAVSNDLSVLMDNLKAPVPRPSAAPAVPATVAQPNDHQARSSQGWVAFARSSVGSMLSRGMWAMGWAMRGGKTSESQKVETATNAPPQEPGIVH